MAALLEGLAALARSLFPGGRLEQVEPLGPDASGGGAEEKALGYGRPIKVTVRDAEGRAHAFVFRRQTANEFGHDRRADRVEGALLAFEQFGATPGHARALDVGLVAEDGGLVSLRGTGEPYLVTEWVDGTVYADDPGAVAARFREAGAARIHVVDLDGARAGRPVNGEAVRAIAAAFDRRGVS